jgi:hypothetical protein
MDGDTAWYRVDVESWLDPALMSARFDRNDSIAEHTDAASLPDPWRFA